MLPSRSQSPALQAAVRQIKSPNARLVVTATAVVVFATLHFVLAAASIQNKSATFDEVAHITAGYSYWTQGDYRLHPENGNLPQRWMSLPIVLFSDVQFPRVSGKAWKQSDLWQLGDEFFYASDNDFRSMLATSRISIAIVSVALCIFVFFWSRRLFGTVGGVISLVLCATSPAVLAHGRLATSDLFVTLFFAASIWSIWELLHRVTPLRVVAGAVAVSGLFLCKTSAALILPIAGIMALVALIPEQAIVVRLSKRRELTLSSQSSRRLCVLVTATAIGFVAYASVWSAFGFRYSASRSGDHEFYKFGSLDAVAERGGGVGAITKWLGDRRVLPEAYLYGVAYVAAHEERPAFFNGDYRTTGWPQFFPYCLAVKTPFAMFGLLAVSMLGLVQSRSNVKHSDKKLGNASILYDLTPIGIALFVLWSVFLVTKLNIGHRHILPTYPLMFVLAGGSASVFRTCAKRSQLWRLVCLTVVALLLWSTSEAVASYPHYLGYFNSLVPKDRAYRHLVDSSLDWGQDLPSLRMWLDKNATDKDAIYLGYFGNSKPSAHGIDAIELPLLGFGNEPLELQAGIYCISATCLQGIYGEAPGRWNVQYEDYYQQLNQQFETDPPTEFEAQQQWDVLKVRRLCSFLRQREPDANAGYSILIYRVSSDELHQALHASPVELDPISWEMERAMQAIERQRGAN